MSNLANCPRCGNIFVKALRPVCEKCAKDFEKMFEKVYQYIRKRENRSASLQDVVDATEVSEEYIFQFIREGRLKLNHFPNLAVPCESCGKMTRSGRLCSACKDGINRDLNVIQTEQEIAERHREKEREKYQTYKTMNDRLNK